MAQMRRLFTVPNSPNSIRVGTISVLHIFKDLLSDVLSYKGIVGVAVLSVLSAFL